MSLKKMIKLTIGLFLLSAIFASCCKQYSCTCYLSNGDLDNIKTAKTSKEKAGNWCATLDEQQGHLKEGHCELKREK